MYNGIPIKETQYIKAHPESCLLLEQMIIFEQVPAVYRGLHSSLLKDSNVNRIPSVLYDIDVLFERCPLRGVPLYIILCGCMYSIGQAWVIVNEIYTSDRCNI